MLSTRDETVHNIEEYGADYTSLDSALNESYEEFPLVKMCLGAILPKTEKNSKGLIKTLQLQYWYADSYFERLQKIQSSVYKILIGIDPKMTDVEKVLYVHDYIVSNTEFNSSKVQYHYPASVLVEGVGVCDSYTEAFNYIIGLLGIESSYAVSKSQNHKWIYIKLDGEWYHIDACWDDVQNTGVPISHEYFLRNDEEFSRDDLKHNTSFKPKNIPSTSTRFKDWFVHDVNGELLYFGGYWYYIDEGKGAIIKRKIEGKDYTVVFQGDNITITDLRIVNSKLEFKTDTENYVIEL